MWWIRDNRSNRIAICVSLTVDYTNYKQNLFLNGALLNSYKHPNQTTVVFQSKSSNYWNFYAFAVRLWAFYVGIFLLCFHKWNCCLWTNLTILFFFSFWNKWCQNGFEEFHCSDVNVEFVLIQISQMVFGLQWGPQQSTMNTVIIDIYRN